MTTTLRSLTVAALLFLLAHARPAIAQTTMSGETLRVARAAAPIKIDGDLSDEGWREVPPVTTWYEVNPGDSTPPRIRNVGRIAYDEHFLYAAFEFEDPNPQAIRAPYSDRDDASIGFYDFGGIFLDAGASGHTANLFVATPRNIQVDSIIDDSSGEDVSPNFFWESATRIVDRGWTLELRIPFSSLRYKNSNPQTWAIMMYRNYPRDRNYQFLSARMPRGFNCFVCHANPLVGLQELPTGSHVVAAPYVSASSTAAPSTGPGSALTSRTQHQGGLDVKYTPTSNTVLDLAINPDFSQVEADVAQISANERFALSLPEKRSFFLEGVDLLQTPIQAVYTRTITSPSWGARMTGKAGGVRYTALIAEDDGGGSVVIPGSQGSTFAAQDFGSTVFVARAKRDIGRSFIGVLITDREGRDSASHNRVVGTDFQWRPGAADAITGQWLMSDTRTPIRPDLAREWTGQSLTSQAGALQWNHTTTRLDVSAAVKDVGELFRAEAGFVPQVGFRQWSGEAGWTLRPSGFVSKLRPFVSADRQTDRDGALIARGVRPGIALNTAWNGMVMLHYLDDEIRAGNSTIGRRQLGYAAQISPSRLVSIVGISGATGQQIDFVSARPGTGTTLNVAATLNPTNHFSVALTEDQSWVNVDNSASARQRLFLARVSRVRGTYTFTSRMFVRATVQYVSTTREPGLYPVAVPEQEGAVSGQLLLSYKLNWQSVLFVGYGDDRTLSMQDRFEKTGRQLFVKLSYAVQR